MHLATARRSFIAPLSRDPHAPAASITYVALIERPPPDDVDLLSVIVQGTEVIEQLSEPHLDWCEQKCREEEQAWRASRDGNSTSE